MLKHFKPYFINLPGWCTKRKIVVFESDDWGTVRMASKAAYQHLLRQGYPVDQCAYNRNDALENDEDVEQLAEVLNGVKDCYNNPVKFTLNNIVANPDFPKIKAADFQAYYYEPFTETLLRYPDRNRVMEHYQQGIEAKVFQPQFHGREHVHVRNWLQALNSAERLFLDAFRENMFTTYKGADSSCREECLDAMAAYAPADIAVIERAVEEGLDLFEGIWGFRSASVIAPCYTWQNQLEDKLLIQGIQHIQTGRVQKIPQFNGLNTKVKRKWMGQRNKVGQFYTIRNAVFEPSTNLHYDWLSHCLNDIKVAFTCRKPAIISTHRLNYIGAIHPENRSRGLQLLRRLLQQIKTSWPDVEFMSSDQLGNLIIDN